MKHSNLIKFSLLVSCLILITACKTTQHNKVVQSIEPLVNVEWLKSHLNDSDLILLDASVTITMDDKGGFSQGSGLDQYNLGHIPNAGFADFTTDLSAESDLDFIMPSAAQFKMAMENLGVGNNSTVVLYSSENNVWATRLWWMLRWAGFDNVGILDGGLEAWKNQGYSLSTDKVIRTKQSSSGNQLRFAGW